MAVKPSLKPRDWIVAPSVILGALFVQLLIWISISLSVDYSDAFETFLNARAISALSNEGYTFKRPILFSLMYTPWFLLERFIPFSNFGFTVSHLASTLIYLITIWVAYRFFRLFWERSYAFLGTLLLAFNPLVLHQAPFVKEDIPGILFSLLAFYFYLKSKSGNRIPYLFYSGLAITAAIEIRRYLIPAFAFILLAAELLTGQIRFSFQKKRKWIQGQHLAAKTAVLGVMPVLLFFLFPTLLYPLIGRASLLDAPFTFIRELQFHRGLVSEVFESPLEGLAFLMKSVSPPLVAMAVIGLYHEFRYRPREAMMPLLWFVVFTGITLFLIGQKVSRYIFPILPPFYYFAVSGIQCSVKAITHQLSGPSLRLIITRFLFMTTVLFYPVKLGLAESVKFLDPFYSTPFEETITNYAVKLAGERDIYWIGHPYALYPRDYLFDVNDEDSYIYHFFNHVIRFYSGKMIHGFGGAEALSERDFKNGVFFTPSLAPVVKHGDVLIMNTNKRFISTRSVPKSVYPLIIQRVSRYEFLPVSDVHRQRRHYACKNLPNANITVIPTANGPQIQGHNLPDGAYQVLISFEGVSYPLQSKIVDVLNGFFSYTETRANRNMVVNGFLILGVAEVREFYFR